MTKKTPVKAKKARIRAGAKAGEKASGKAKVKAKAQIRKSVRKAGADEAGVDTKADKAGEIAKNIWLAGLGAYGKAIDAATDVSRDAVSFFEGLVERGQEVEKKARDQIKPIPKPDISKPKIAIEERIEQMRNYLGVNGADAREEEIARLKKQVSSL